MAYLQPWMLWALPAVLLPIVIHMLNRLRYKTVHWAAMIFLLKANRAATRRAKLRQYLLLAFRALIILFLIWAMARPLVGGWIGAAAGGAPETVLILLDRSASMESRGGDAGESKRAHGLALLSTAAKQSAGSRFVLIENVLRQPLEIANASNLGSMQMTEATDTAADIPAMLRAALDYLAKNRPGSAEIWVASDLQASNWRTDSSEWQDIDARFAGLPQSVRVRLLDLSGPPAANISVAVRAADVRNLKGAADAGKAQLNLALELRAQDGHKGTIPLLVTREGVTSQLDIPLGSSVQRESLKFDVPKGETGWGKVELPADANLADNSAYFVYGPPPALKSMVIGEGPGAQRIRFAAAPDKARTDRTAEIASPARAGGLDLKSVALAVWAGTTAPDESAAKTLQAWVESGGVLLCMPPGGEGGAGPLGLHWEAAENAQPRTPFRIAAWDEIDGPLARTDSGASLALARLEMQRRQLPSTGGALHAYATFTDGRPFLSGRKIGSGQLFAFSAQPDTEWGNFGDGLVLLPAVQRMLALGGRRLAPPAMAIAGEWQPASPDETWSAIETDRRRDWRWSAGVYQSGASRIALNRPASEDAPETADRTRIPALLHGVKLTVMADAIELKADRLQSEIWPAMVIAAMLFMCAEMLLATSRAMLPRRAATSNAPEPRPLRRIDTAEARA